MLWWDPRYLIFAGPPMLLALIAQAWVRSAYRKGLQVANAARISGAEGAKELMRRAELSLRIHIVGGELSDAYDPRDDTLHLSQGVANSGSVGALAIVAHELGHALQDEEEYAPMKVRSALVAPVNIGSQLGIVLFFIGFALSSFVGAPGIGQLVSWVGILGFSLAVVFALITLPIEFNASRRGLSLLAGSGLVAEADMTYARRVLSAAALTYVAALAQAVGQVLYFVFLLSGGRRRRS
ncbi:MAG TPA: zinc metallopeptidase [Anaerolineae bacterium]|nr:zinc metallopeptidase [Anaerolineae bacterium]